MTSSNENNPGLEKRETIAKPSQPPVNPWPLGAKRVAMVAGLFCLVISLLLTINHYQGVNLDPIKSPHLTELKAELAKEPMDEALKKRIRDFDLDLRQKLSRHQARQEQGGWLLLAGLAVFVLSIKYATYRRKITRPPKSDVPQEPIAAGRMAVITLSVLAGLAVWFHAQSVETSLSASMVLPAKSEAVASKEPEAKTVIPVATTPFPTKEEIKKNWPRFRGPGGLGISAYTNYPATWNPQTGEGIVWKAPTPIPGPNSPVVWENFVFCSGANAKKREMYCYDATTGKLLWQKSVGDLPGTDPEPPPVMEDGGGGFAPSTVATDGRRVYAIYANADLAAFDYTGKLVWAKNLGKLDNSYGHAASLDQYENRLLVQLDQGNGKDGKSKLLAFDTATGNLAWETKPRPVPNTWSTPITIEVAGKPQIITCGNPWVISYNPADGNEIWRAKVLYGEVTPSPVFGLGMVFTVQEGEKLAAIKPDGTGDVTTNHVVWSADEGLPDICSPLCDGKYVYLCTSHGTITCYDGLTGKKQWEHEYETEFHSSPSVAGDRIFLFSGKGAVIQLQAGPTFKELSKIEMGEEISSSPAFADGRWYIRSKNYLWCIGVKK